MNFWSALLGVLLCCQATFAANAVDPLSEQLGDTPALVVVICEPDGADLATVARMVDETPWTILCQGTSSTELEKLRDWAREAEVLGSRVSVVEADGSSLVLASDMADAVYVSASADHPKWKSEIDRVLHPGGISVAQGRVTRKAAQQGVDQWRHPYHGPDNNVVSTDVVARLPGELRFQTHPTFAPMPNQTLFAGGRIFFFSGHIAFHEREESLLNKLTVLNGYNGLPLWSRLLNPNCVAHNLAKVATDTELVFAEGPDLWMLDAATGDQMGRTVAPAKAAASGDTDWKWVVQEGDTLWAALGPPDASVAPHREKSQVGHWPWAVANEHSKALIENFGSARTLVAYRYPEMTVRWSMHEEEPFDARALCIEGGRIFQLAPDKYMAALDSGTGKTLWRRSIDTSPELFAMIGGAVQKQGWGLGWATYCAARAGDGVVCIAGPQYKKTIAIDFEKGKVLWTSPVPSPHPFFLEDELYVMPRVAQSAACVRVNPITGKVLDQFNLGVIGSCTRLTVTPNQFFFRPGGGEGRTVYVDIGSRELADYEGVVRPGCFDGVVPANGRLYWMPLACDCWQVHGTFSMAPRTALPSASKAAKSTAWAQPSTTTAASSSDWPMFRATSAGSCFLPGASLGKNAKQQWQRELPGGGLTAPTVVGERAFVGAADGTVRALDLSSGETLWQVSADAPVLFPPAYFSGRVVFGGCDGVVYCVDAADGRLLGKTDLAPERRFVNMMGSLMSAWPIGGGIVVDQDGIAYAAAGSTAADGAVVAAIDTTTGDFRWREAFTADREGTEPSFGVQANLLLKHETLYINGGAPAGIAALDATSGGNLRMVRQLEAGMEMFLEPDGTPICAGPELYSAEQVGTTIFNQYQGKVYFPFTNSHLALITGRLFCSKDQEPLDRIVALMNTDPKTGGKMGNQTVPHDVMEIPVDDSILWASDADDIVGVAVTSSGVVALHQDRVEAISVAGQTVWSAPLKAPPVRWGLALAGKYCVVTLTDGSVVCLERE